MNLRPFPNAIISILTFVCQRGFWRAWGSLSPFYKVLGVMWLQVVIHFLWRVWDHFKLLEAIWRTAKLASLFRLKKFSRCLLKWRDNSGLQIWPNFLPARRSREADFSSSEWFRSPGNLGRFLRTRRCVGTRSFCRSVSKREISWLGPIFSSSSSSLCGLGKKESLGWDWPF